MAGGAVVSLYELVRALNDGCYEPVVLFHNASPYADQFKALGARVLFLSEQPRAAPPARAPRNLAARCDEYGRWLGGSYRAAKSAYLTARGYPAILQMTRLMKAEAIDLVHHNNGMLGNRDSVIAAWLAGVPQVCHIRQFEDLSWVEKALGSRVEMFIYNSRSVQERYCRQGIPARKGQVVYNPIDTESFGQPYDADAVRREFGLTARDWLISNVGRLDWWKGQDYFLQAMAEVIQLEPNVKALLVGQSDNAPINQAYFQRLQQLVRDLKLSEHIIFTGLRSDVPKIMAASDIIVHSASEPEPFGRVVVEGMAAGRPVIATAAGGVLDIIEHEVNGLLVPLKNASMMAKAMVGLLQNPDQCRKLGEKARDYASERFAIARHATAVQQIYEQVLGA
jgi:glycosyltransferase involved in cell wall biosynthesis